MNKLQKGMIVAGSTLMGLVGLASTTFAAADPAITNAATDMATTVQENVIASVSAVLPIIVGAAVLILIALVVWKFGRRFLK